MLRGIFIELPAHIKTVQDDKLYNYRIASSQAQ